MTSRTDVFEAGAMLAAASSLTDPDLVPIPARTSTRPPVKKSLPWKRPLPEVPDHIKAIPVPGSSSQPSKASIKKQSSPKKNKRRQ